MYEAWNRWLEPWTTFVGAYTVSGVAPFLIDIENSRASTLSISTPLLKQTNSIHPADSTHHVVDAQCRPAAQPQGAGAARGAQEMGASREAEGTCIPSHSASAAQSSMLTAPCRTTSCAQPTTGRKSRSSSSCPRKHATAIPTSSRSK